MRFHLTAEATAHSVAYAVPPTFTGIVGYGRGDRTGTKGSEMPALPM
jgi:hypothetical protein